TKDGKLLFNWRIIMAPISAIDYVIVHELCHLKYSTHSPEFWNDVKSLFPK
ncbi:MAG: M48 metallopeptidase family protein, partial [Promethearchaeota archaeon]